MAICSPSPSLSHSLFLSSQFLFLSFFFSSPFLLLFLLLSLLVRTLFFSLSFFSFFFFEGTACTVYFRDVRNDTTDCNQLYLYWNKENFFLAREFVYSDVCNFLVRSLAELSIFLLSKCPAFLFMMILNKVNSHTYLKFDDTLLKITIRGLLIKTLKVLSVPRVR